MNSKFLSNQDGESDIIDVDLINLLKYCNELYHKHKINDEDYQEELLMKSIELGKKNK